MISVEAYSKWGWLDENLEAGGQKKKKTKTKVTQAVGNSLKKE